MPKEQQLSKEDPKEDQKEDQEEEKGLVEFQEFEEEEDD